MRREFHVRFCERLEVQFLGPTRRAVPDGKAVGARSVYLAASAEWQCIADGSATVDAA
jgi:hypothetical protein